MAANESPTPEQAVQALLGEFQPDANLPYDETVQRALYTARYLQQRAMALQTPQERKQQMELDRMIQNPADKATLTQLTDQAFRSEKASRAADQLIHILDVQGVPRFFSPFERTLLKGFQSFGSYLPGVAVPLVKEKMQRETANVILPAKTEILAKHLQERRGEGVRMNVNYLGEAILGEREADRRFQEYLRALQLPDIEVVSVKISTIYSQIHPIAREVCVEAMCERMELLYRAASKGTFTRADGSVVPKFVYLDMEEYRDMSLTADVFMRTLSMPGLEHVSAGIVLQAYIPDSHAMQRRLTQWAQDRVAAGGAPITMRIVKGANMEMERVEASTRGWPQAPFKRKMETDANYKRMVRYAMQEENRQAVKPGIASHNLFDIAYALVLAVEKGALADIQFEMLEGMANHQRRALHELTRNLLLYAPACHRKDFIHAIGYLIRRLDENTGEENFLRHAFNIRVDSPAWKQLEESFLNSFDLIEQLPDEPRRRQDRRTEEPQVDLSANDWRVLVNEPDTDFGLPQNAEWARQIVDRWKPRCGQDAIEIPLYVAGNEITEERELRQCLDPSRPGVIVARYKQANQEDVERAVQSARSDPDQWRSLSPDERDRILRNVAVEIRKARGDLMGAAMADGGKTLMESDPEVSEAVDFVEFYRQSATYFQTELGVDAQPRGVVVVVSPWNFPIAIPCGGIVSALAAGNTVILKPASHSVLVAHQLCECFYRAGVPRTALQLFPCSGGTVGQQLVAHPDVDTVILTGGTETALNMLRFRPDTHLLAETGGKNATIVTALSDRDSAIKNVVHSAFSHCGQKCSATSLLMLEREVFEDEEFRAALVDAVSSLKVGSVWDLENKLGPLISPPAGDLDRGLKELEPEETWALRPEHRDHNPCLYSPGIKWNVQPGSYTHQTEFFGPVLGVMCFDHLSEAISYVNQTGYGLTSGLESLDDREQETWLQMIRAGNLYVNRPTTGAIVLRQPFGGMGKSAFGPGIKAGGPNYVAQLMRFSETDDPTRDNRIENGFLARLLEDLRQDGQADESSERLVRALHSFDFQARQEFLRQHDHFRLVGQDNFRRYLPIERLCIRVDAEDSWFELVARAAAAQAVGCHIIVSSPHGVATEWVQRLHDLTEHWAAQIEFIEQTDEQLIHSIEQGEINRLRYAAANRVPNSVRQAVIGRYVHIADEPVLAEGRIELLWYVQEQSLCSDYHRYGNLGVRVDEQRGEVL